MADKITKSNLLNVGIEYSNADETITTKIVIPDCKHGLTENDIKNYIDSSLGSYRGKGGVVLNRNNIYTADETATEKIEINLE